MSIKESLVHGNASGSIKFTKCYTGTVSVNPRHLLICPPTLKLIAAKDILN